MSGVGTESFLTSEETLQHQEAGRQELGEAVGVIPRCSGWGSNLIMSGSMQGPGTLETLVSLGHRFEAGRRE